VRLRSAGTPSGPPSAKEGKIFIESRKWCVLGGAGANNGRAAKAFESVHTHLFTKDGIILQQPLSHLPQGARRFRATRPANKEMRDLFCHKQHLDPPRALR